MQDLNRGYSWLGPSGIMTKFIILCLYWFCNFLRAKFQLLGWLVRCALALTHSLCQHQTMYVCLEHSPWISLGLSEHKEHCTKSNVSSTWLSGAQGICILKQRILVSWGHPPQEHEPNKNKSTVNLSHISQHNCCFFSTTFSISAWTHVSASTLTRLTLKFYSFPWLPCTKAEVYDRPFA